MAEQELSNVVYYIVTAAGNVVYCVEVIKFLERTEIRMAQVAFNDGFRWNSA